MLADFAKVQQGEMSVAESTTFMQYYKFTGLQVTDALHYVFYSAHAETVAPLLRYFNVQELAPFTPPPSSFLHFEFYSVVGMEPRIAAYFVQGNDIDIVFDQDSSDFVKETESALQNYAARVGAQTVSEMCKLDYVHEDPWQLSSAEDFKNKLYAAYNFSPDATNPWFRLI